MGDKGAGGITGLLFIFEVILFPNNLAELV